MENHFWDEGFTIFRYYSPIIVKEYALTKMGYKEENFPKEWCFCCEYTNNAGSIASGITDRRLCASCPIIWNSKHCFDYYGEYKCFCLAIDTNDFVWARRIADRISKFPEREDDKYDII